jgi:hypothetical protein
VSKVVQAVVLKRTKFIEEFLIYQFCHSLRPDFESIRKQLLNAPTTPSIADVLSALIAEETCLLFSVISSQYSSSLSEDQHSEGQLF